MSQMKFVLYFIIVIFIAGYTYQRDHKMPELLLENIEAFSDPEHTDNPTDPEMGHDNIDGTLVPYRKLSSKEVFIGHYQTPTRVPCCEKDESKYSGCAKGLSGC